MLPQTEEFIRLFVVYGWKSLNISISLSYMIQPNKAVQYIS